MSQIAAEQFVQTVCPTCHGVLVREQDRYLRCSQCLIAYPARSTVDVFLKEIEWKECLGHIEAEQKILAEYSFARRHSVLTEMYYDMWVSRMFEHVPAHLYGPLLEIMAGECEITRRLPDQIVSASAFDINVKAIEQAAAAFAETGDTRTQVLCGTATHFPFPNNSFEIIMVQGGLHHIRPHLRQVLSELYRVLKPGGILIGSEPANDQWIIRHLRLLQYYISKSQGNDEAEDGFTRSELEHLFTPIGLKLEKYEHFGFIAYMLMCNMDLLSVLKPLRRCRFLGHILLALDHLLESLPVIHKMGWANLFLARKQ